MCNLKIVDAALEWYDVKLRVPGCKLTSADQRFDRIWVWKVLSKRHCPC